MIKKIIGVIVTIFLVFNFCFCSFAQIEPTPEESKKTKLKEETEEIEAIEEIEKTQPTKEMSETIESKQQTIVKVEYQYNPVTNKVLATMISNVELQDTKISWKLSEDKKQYTFEFDSNTTYQTTVTDIYGNVIEVLIEVTGIKEQDPIVKPGVRVEYQYKKETNTVVATMISNTELQDTKISWKLSADKKHYTFEFNSNTTYTTTVVDVNGNVIEVLIEVTRYKRYTNANNTRCYGTISIPKSDQYGNCNNGI